MCEGHWQTVIGIKKKKNPRDLCFEGRVYTKIQILNRKIRNELSNYKEFFIFSGRIYFTDTMKLK